MKGADMNATKIESNRDREIRWAKEDRETLRERLQEDLALEVRSHILDRLYEINAFLKKHNAL
jgi:hypothetical protein